MPLGRILDHREWEDLIQKVKDLPEADFVGEYQDSLVKREDVISILERHSPESNTEEGIRNT